MKGALSRAYGLPIVKYLSSVWYFLVCPGILIPHSATLFSPFEHSNVVLYRLSFFVRPYFLGTSHSQSFCFRIRSFFFLSYSSNSLLSRSPTTLFISTRGFRLVFFVNRPFQCLHLSFSVQLCGYRIISDVTLRRAAHLDVTLYRQLWKEAVFIDAERFYAFRYVTSRVSKITLPGFHEFQTAFGAWAERWNHLTGRRIFYLLLSLKTSCEIPWSLCGR